MRHFLILFVSAFFLFPLAASMAQTIAPVPYPPINRSIDKNEQTTPPSNPTPSSNQTSPTNNGEEQPLSLVARISETGSVINDGVTWRIFDAEPAENGEMILLEKSEQSIASFSLTSGNYIIHASYGQAQASETINVGEGGTKKTLILNSGALRLNAAIAGDLPIRYSMQKFDISTSSIDENERVIIAKGVKPNTIINLNAGNYFVISYFGSTNATVSADIKVEPGQLTDATLYHRASSVSFKLVSEVAGREIADVDWTIKDSNDKIIYSSINSFPSMVLSEGDYVVIAKRGQNVYNRDFSISAGPAQEIEVLISVY